MVPFYDLLFVLKGGHSCRLHRRSSFEYLWLNTFVNCHFSLQHSQTPAENRNHLALAWPRIVDKLGNSWAFMMQKHKVFSRKSHVLALNFKTQWALMQIDIPVIDLNEEHKHHQEFRWASQLVATQEIYINRHLQRSDELLKLQCQISIPRGVFITMTGGPLQEYTVLQIVFGWSICRQPISNVLSDFLN